jgi:hypothetical protein
LPHRDSQSHSCCRGAHLTKFWPSRSAGKVATYVRTLAYCEGVNYKEKWRVGQVECTFSSADSVREPGKAADPAKAAITTITKREALEEISKTRKRSRERAAMIKLMIAEGYVPVKAKCLYALIRDTEVKGLPVGDDKWGGVGRPTREAAAKKGLDHGPHGVGQDKYLFARRKEEEKRMICAANKIHLRFSTEHRSYRASNKKSVSKPSLHGKIGWKGSIEFPRWQFRRCMIAPVSSGMDLAKVKADFSRRNLSIYRMRGQNEGTFGDYAKDRDLCSMMGRHVTIRGHRVYRIYFNPELFPPPTDVSEGGSCSTFRELCTIIRDASSTSGSPVVCNGNEGKHGKVFTCKHNRERRGKPDSTHCPFRFTVKWDDIGYYVHLSKRNSARKNCNGCRWHLCPGYPEEKIGAEKEPSK